MKNKNKRKKKQIRTQIKKEHKNKNIHLSSPPPSLRHAFPSHALLSGLRTVSSQAQEHPGSTAARPHRSPTFASSLGGGRESEEKDSERESDSERVRVIE
jgi:hypothetical protein